jgi:type II secretory pathway pseudopilin PulG
MTRVPFSPAKPISQPAAKPNGSFIVQPIEHSLTMKNTQQNSGFTLVELLVTITIIIALAAIIAVSMRGMRQSADTAVALNRIRSLGLANASYAADNSGRYVPVFEFDQDQKASVMWFYNKEFLKELIGDPQFLNDPEEFEGKDGFPESVLDPVTVRAKKKYWSRISGSFGYNAENTKGGGWGEANAAARHTTLTVANPVRTCQFITATDWLAKYSGRFLWQTQGYEGKTPDGKIAYRHKGKALVVFYDCHTEAITPKDMTRFDTRGGVANVFWGGTNN